MSEKEKICLHDFELLSPPESSVAGSSTLFGGVIGGFNSPAIFKCIKCKKLYTSDKHGNLMLVRIREKNKISSPSDEIKIEVRKKNIFEIKINDFASNLISEFKNNILNKKDILGAYNKYANRIDIYRENPKHKNYFLFENKEEPYIDIGCIYLGVTYKRDEDDLCIGSDKWISKIEVFDKSYMKDFIELGKSYKCNLIINETENNESKNN